MKQIADLTGLSLPESDINEFSSLPADTRRDVSLWMDSLRDLREKRVQKIGDAMIGLAARMHCSVQTARRMYDYARMGRTLKGGRHVTGWRALVNWAKVPDPMVRLPQALIDGLWRPLCERYKGRTAFGKRAWAELIALWRHTDQEIPGYATPPPAGPCGYPVGWSYANLMRFAPSKFERVVSRQGRSAAAQYRPTVLTTRVGLSVGQYYLFDDVEHDVLVNFLAVNKRAMRPLELCCLDLFSASKVLYGVRPTLESQEDKRIKLKDSDMRFLLAAVLSQIGYRRDGTMLVVEHGTAAIREDLERALFDATGGAIQVERSGIEGAPALVGWYEGRGRGNFRLKAALESSHNLLHNATAMLPAQTGSNERLNAPEELHGRRTENDKLIAKALAVLPPEKIQMLRWPVMHYQQYCGIVDAIYRWIDGRIEHELEGWEKAGLVTSEFRLALDDKRWLPAAMLDAVPADRRRAIDAIAAQPGHARIRRLSPAEVFHGGCKDLVKLPIAILPDIIGRDLAQPRKVNDKGMIAFEDHELDTEPFLFLARARTGNGHDLLLRDGETYETFINPFDRTHLIVCDGKGAFLGWCERYQKPCKVDTEALHKTMGMVAHTEAVRLAPYRMRHEHEVAQRRVDTTWNDMVFSGAPVTPDEKTRAAAMKHFVPADLATAPAAAPSDDLDEPSEKFSAERLL